MYFNYIKPKQWICDECRFHTTFIYVQKGGRSCRPVLYKEFLKNNWWRKEMMAGQEVFLQGCESRRSSGYRVIIYPINSKWFPDVQRFSKTSSARWNARSPLKLRGESRSFKFFLTYSGLFGQEIAHWIWELLYCFLYQPWWYMEPQQNLLTLPILLWVTSCLVLKEWPSCESIWGGLVLGDRR